MTIWKTIPDHSRYEASENGDIRCRETMRLIKQTKLKAGYLMCRIYRDSKGRPVSTLSHPTILRTFIGNPPEGMEACHGNGIRDDNRLSNLRWDTRSANCLDAVRHGTHRCRFNSRDNKRTKLSLGCAERIKEATLFGAITADLAAAYGVTRQHVNQVRRGENWT